MKNNKFFLLFNIAILPLTACTPSLSINEISRDLWQKNITEGELFSDSFNFTMKREITENNVTRLDGTIKNDYGKVQITTAQGEISYYELTSPSFYSYYRDEENRWMKIQNKNIGSYYQDILEATILYNFSYDDFTYNHENKAYFADDFEKDNYKFAHVEFSFQNQKVISFLIVDGDKEYKLTALDYNQTTVTLPEAKEIDTSIPYANKKYHIDNFVLEDNSYQEKLEKELTDIDIYLTGEDYISSQIVNTITPDEVYVFYGFSNDYDLNTKTLNISFDKRQGYGLEASWESDINISKSVIKDNNITITFDIGSKEDSISTLVYGTLTNEEAIQEEYTYQDPAQQLVNKLISKKTLVTKVETEGEDVFAGGYLVFNSNNHVEFHLNNNMVLLGYMNTEAFSGKRLYITFEGQYNELNNKSSALNIYIEAAASAETLEFTLFYKTIRYEVEASFTNIEASVVYEDLIQNNRNMEKDKWDDIFINLDFLKDGITFDCNRIIIDSNNEVISNSGLLFGNGRIEEIRDGNPQAYYKSLGENLYRVWSFDFENEKWISYERTLPMSYFLEKLGLNYAFSYEKATFDGWNYIIENDGGYKNISVSFLYGSLIDLQRTNTTSSNRKEFYHFTYNIDPIVLPNEQ